MSNHKPVMSRRQFLKTAVGASLGCACSAAAFGNFGNNVAYASTLQGSGKILVLINFFGGIDGLSWAVPYSRGVYYDRRPNIAIPANQVLQLNSEVGLHPSWAPLYNTVGAENRLAVIQQVGYPNANRSHFESQDIWSFGRRAKGTADGRGWIGRLADLYFDASYDTFGVGVSQRIDFTTEKPFARPVVLNNLRDFGFQSDWNGGSDNPFRANIAQGNTFSSLSTSGLRKKVRESMQTIYMVGQQLQDIDRQYRSNVTYPNNALGGNLKEISKLIQSNIGTQIFYTGQGGWDTHSNQVAALSGNLGGVAQAVNAFITDLKAMGKWDQVCIAFFSEFGRNCFENGTRGTDHGAGNSMVVTGGGVNGGVYGLTPTDTDLRREDLDYVVDFRAVFKSVIRYHLGLNPDPVFEEAIPRGDVPLPLF